MLFTIMAPTGEIQGSVEAPDVNAALNAAKQLGYTEDGISAVPADPANPGSPLPPAPPATTVSETDNLGGPAPTVPPQSPAASAPATSPDSSAPSTSAPTPEPEVVAVAPITEAPGFFQTSVNKVKKFFTMVGNAFQEVGEEVVTAAKKAAADAVKAAEDAKTKLEADLQAAKKATKKGIDEVLDAIESPVLNERNDRFGVLAKALMAAGYRISLAFPDNGHTAQVTITDKDGNQVAQATGADKVYAIENAIEIAKLQEAAGE